MYSWFNRVYSWLVDRRNWYETFRNASLYIVVSNKFIGIYSTIRVLVS